MLRASAKFQAIGLAESMTDPLRGLMRIMSAERV